MNADIDALRSELAHGPSRTHSQEVIAGMGRAASSNSGSKHVSKLASDNNIVP